MNEKIINTPNSDDLIRHNMTLTDANILINESRKAKNGYETAVDSCSKKVTDNISKL